MMNDPQNNKSPREKWDEWRQTKFSDDEIWEAINTSRQYSGCDYADEPYAQSCAMRAQAMIAYNEMIENRIERERLAL
jgi:hypothetical protein